MHDIAEKNVNLILFCLFYHDNEKTFQVKVKFDFYVYHSHLMKASYLEENEKELLKERVLLGKSEIRLVLTNEKIIFMKNPRELINSIKYDQITKIQNSKPSSKESNENTISKIRIIDQKGVKTDFSIKGTESISISKKITSLINKQRKSAEQDSQNKKESDESQKIQQSDSHLKQETQKEAGKKIMTENTLKASFLEQNAVAKKMYKDLVVEEKILTEEEFWNNFKSEIAEEKALCQKNGFVFAEKSFTEAENGSDNEINRENTQTEEVKIAQPKTEINIPDLNLVEIEQETINNTEEFKPSIFIQEEVKPTLPDENGYINFFKDLPTEIKNETDDNEEEELGRPEFSWFKEVVQPLTVDPNEFKEEAETFLSNLLSFSESFYRIPETELPSMKDAKSIINEISDINYKRFNYQNINNTEIDKGLETLRRHKMEQQILLVHFWQNYEKDIENPNNREKTLRLRSKLEELKNILEDEKKNIKSKVAHKALIPLYEEIESSIYKALEMQFQ